MAFQSEHHCLHPCGLDMPSSPKACRVCQPLDISTRPYANGPTAPSSQLRGVAQPSRVPHFRYCSSLLVTIGRRVKAS